MKFFILFYFCQFILLEEEKTDIRVHQLNIYMKEFFSFNPEKNPFIKALHEIEDGRGNNRTIEKIFGKDYAKIQKQFEQSRKFAAGLVISEMKFFQQHYNQYNIVFKDYYDMMFFDLKPQTLYLNKDTYTFYKAIPEGEFNYVFTKLTQLYEKYKVLLIHLDKVKRIFYVKLHEMVLRKHPRYYTKFMGQFSSQYAKDISAKKYDQEEQTVSTPPKQAEMEKSQIIKSKNLFRIMNPNNSLTVNDEKNYLIKTTIKLIATILLLFQIIFIIQLQQIMGQDNSKIKSFNDNIRKEHKEFNSIYSQSFNNKKVLQLEDVQSFFLNRNLFSEKFYYWMCFLSYRKTANRESFMYACEIFLLESSNIIKESYQNHSFNFFEIFIQLVFAKKLRGIKKFDHDDCKIFIDVLFDFMFGNTAREDLKNSLLQSLLKKCDFTKEFALHEFLNRLKALLPTGIYFLKKHFECLLKQNKSIELPQIEKHSLLDEQILFLIGLTNSKILNQKNIECIYDLNKQGKSFFNLANSLIGYSSQIIILIQNQYQTTKGIKKDIFGIYTNCIWQDSIVHFGNNENYLFRILQTFEVFYPTFNQRNYIYLNTKEVNNKHYKTGLSFGGDINKPRVWIDQDIFRKSYVDDDNDKTFQSGLITDSYYENLHINNIQIFAFPNLKAQKIQEEYKKYQEIMRRSSTAQDKKIIDIIEQKTEGYDLLQNEIRRNTKRSSLIN